MFHVKQSNKSLTKPPINQNCRRDNRLARARNLAIRAGSMDAVRMFALRARNVLVRVARLANAACSDGCAAVALLANWSVGTKDGKGSSLVMDVSGY